MGSGSGTTRTVCTRRRLLATGGSALAVSIAGCLGGADQASAEPQFDVATSHLSPTCDCCELHADYLASGGVDVDVVEHSNDELLAMKDDLGIPQDLRSCHTTELEAGYVIEGHVPVAVINEVLEEQPDAEVIALPGMPAGSPGMPGSKDEEWVFYAIDEDGEVSEFTRK